MLTNIYILIPALVNTGPIKGAIALANGLTHYFKVYVVVLKHVDEDVAALLNSKITIISFSSIRSFWRKYSSYKSLLLNEGSKKRSVSISFCFSADFVNWTVRNKVTIISSVRGNLPQNYCYTYGVLGRLFARFHMFLLKDFHHVVAMSSSMAAQLKKYGINRISLIGNFIDEHNLEMMVKSSPNSTGKIINLLFLGSLSNRKRPELLIAATSKMKEKGLLTNVSFLGDGPMRKELELLVNQLGLDNEIVFYGHVSNPYTIIQNADYMVLPSESEGISRAVLETLYFGIPCVIRGVDASRELITNGENGYVFDSDDELLAVLMKIAKEFVPLKMKNTRNLIPDFFRYDINIEKFKGLIES